MNVLNLATFTEEDASTVPKNLSSFEITEDKVYEKLTHLNVGQLIGELPPEQKHALIIPIHIKGS